MVCEQQGQENENRVAGTGGPGAPGPSFSFSHSGGEGPPCAGPCLHPPFSCPFKYSWKEVFYHPLFFSGVSAASCGDLKQTSCAQHPETRPNVKGLQRTGRPTGLFLLAACPTISSSGQAIVPTARYPAPVLFICLSICVRTLNFVRAGRGARGVTSASPSYSQTKELLILKTVLRHSLLIHQLFMEQSQRAQHWVRPLILSETSQ